MALINGLIVGAAVVFFVGAFAGISVLGRELASDLRGRIPKHRRIVVGRWS